MMATTDPRVVLERERMRLRAMLESIKKETANVTSDGDTFSESGSADQHPADMGTETFELEKDVSIQNGFEASLADVEWALKRLDDGTYGTCETCKGKIPKARLQAMPATRYCLDDQQRAERERRAA
jgi:RNA polymerase-binding transcription factor DksA